MTRDDLHRQLQVWLKKNNGRRLGGHKLVNQEARHGGRRHWYVVKPG